MNRFIPKKVFFEPDALEYPLGKQLKQHFNKMDIPMQLTTSHNRVTGITGKTAKEKYVKAKSSLVIGVRRTLKFAGCKPSAHYQLPLVTSCPGLCEYCYLQTTLGPKPIIRVYVNLDEIFDQAVKYIEDRAPQITKFEGSATSDPVPVEYLTGSLRHSIEFFASQKLGKFRFVTKYTEIDPLLHIKHNNHTEIRFSLNSASIINKYEKATASMHERINAVKKTAESGYPFGILIAPIIVYDNWQSDYQQLISLLADALSSDSSFNFELITHRFTPRAKKNIDKVFPNSTLPMNKETRKFKYGQFGYGKYVYPKKTMEEIKSFFNAEIEKHFPNAQIAYLV